MSRARRSVLMLCLAMFALASGAGPAPPADPQLAAQAQTPAQAQASAPRPAPAPAQRQATAAAAAAATATATATAGYSASSLYNLANSFARAGKPGLAVLNYERARLLDPKDPDIEANLRHVRETSGQPPDSRSKFQRAAEFADPRLLAWAGILGLSLAGIAAWARVGSKSHRRKLLLAMWVGICVLGVSVANGVALWPVIHEAVVIAPSTPVRVSPVTEQEPLFVLPEAAIVAVRAEHDGFILVQTQNERSGWVPGRNVARIVPVR